MESKNFLKYADKINNLSEYVPISLTSWTTPKTSAIGKYSQLEYR